MSEEPKQSSFRITDRRGEPKEEAPKTEAPERPEPSPPPRDTRNRESTHEEYPIVDFSTFFVSMSTSALVHMGLVKDPHTGQPAKNLPLAKQEIDILSMLEQKTKGNLSKEEKRLMDEALYDLRVRFVEVSKH
jgi:hypothetical protein